MNGPPRVSSSVLHPRWPLLSFSLFSRYASYLGLRPAAAPRGSEWEWDTSEVMWRVGMNGEQERSEVRETWAEPSFIWLHLGLTVNLPVTWGSAPLLSTLYTPFSTSEGPVGLSENGVSVEWKGVRMTRVSRTVKEPRNREWARCTRVIPPASRLGPSFLVSDRRLVTPSEPRSGASGG